MVRNLIELDYAVDRPLLLELAKTLEPKRIVYSDARYSAAQLVNWLWSPVSDPLVDKIQKDLNINGVARIYWLASRSVLPYHTDDATECGINFILSPGASPISIMGRDYQYQAAIVNTRVPHRVINGADERILLKFSIYNETYQQTAERLENFWLEQLP